MEIGKRIRSRRQELVLTLAQVAKKTGIALATLSRIEKGHMTGTLESHAKIAQALGMEITDLYEPRSRIKHTPVLSNLAQEYRLLCRQIPLAPGERTSIDKNLSGSEHYVYVIGGKVEVKIGKGRHRLKQGNSLVFKSASYSFKNIGKSEAQIISVRGVKEAL